RRNRDGGVDQEWNCPLRELADERRRLASAKIAIDNGTGDAMRSQKAEGFGNARGRADDAAAHLLDRDRQIEREVKIIFGDQDRGIREHRRTPNLSGSADRLSVAVKLAKRGGDGDKTNMIQISCCPSPV